MARKPVEIDPESLLCTACDKQVELDDNDEWQHKAKGIKSHYVTKVVKYADWAAKRTADRTIVNKDGVATRGPNVRPAKKATATPAAAPALPRRTQAERAAIRAENDAARAKAIAERQTQQDNMEEAWTEKKGYHIPLINSSAAVVRPSTGEIYIPMSGRVTGQMDPSAIPPKPGSPERDKLNESVNHVHEDHPWTPVYAEDGRLARSPKIPVSENSRYKTGEFGYAGRVRADQFKNGMLKWANRLKKQQDPNDENEWTVWRAGKQESGDYRGLPYGVSDIARLKDTWSISSRPRYCEKCSPTITLPNGSVKANPVKSVERPPMVELGRATGGSTDTTMADEVSKSIARAGGGTGRGRQRKDWLQQAFTADQDKPAE